MLEFPFGVKRIGVDHHHASPKRSQAHHQILDEVRHLHGNAIALLKPRTVLQPTRKLGREPVKIGVGQRMPHAAAGGLIPVGRQRLLKQGNDRGVAVGINAAGNAQRIKPRVDRALDRFRHGFVSGNSGGLGMMWIAGCGVNLPPRRCESNPQGSRHP